MSGFIKKKKNTSPLQAYRNVERYDEESTPKTVFAQETEVAEAVGGRRHTGSGASMYSKSDGSSSRYQIEAKQTKHSSMSIKLEWVIKITREAIARARVPLLSVRFLNIGFKENGVESDWILMPLSEFKELYELAKGDKPELPRWTEEE